MEEGVVQRTVCFSWSSTCCFAEVKVQVRNCYGYHVYKLQPTFFVVKARYCIGKYSVSFFESVYSKLLDAILDKIFLMCPNFSHRHFSNLAYSRR